MKNLLIMFMMSLCVSVSAQNQWQDLYLADDVTAIAINSNSMAAFSLGQYYLSPVKINPEWSARSLPINEAVQKAEFVGDELFVLFINRDLYRLSQGIWDLVLTDVLGISANTGHLFSWNQNWLYEYNDTGWEYQLMFPGLTYVAGGNTVVATSIDYNMYQGFRPNALNFLKEVELEIKEIVLSKEEYLYVGSVIGLAAYHLSPLDACYIYDHILTAGEFRSAVFFQGRAYVAGVLGSKGVIFEAQDLSNITWFPGPIQQLRANDFALLALSTNGLHLSLNGSSALKERINLSKVSFQVAPNPIEESSLFLSSEIQTGAKVINSSGQEVSYIFIKKGINKYNVAGWPAGVYLILANQSERASFIIK